MSILLAFGKHKSTSVMSCTINGKRCCSAYSHYSEVISDKEKRLANLGQLRVSPRNKVLRMRVIRAAKPQAQNQTEGKESHTTSDVPIPRDSDFRKNALNIQMLSKSLHRQIFGDSNNRHHPDTELIDKARQKLQEHGLWKNEIDFLKDVSLNLPALKGKDIEQHFWVIGEEQCKPYRELVNSFIKSGLPKPPTEWVCQKGWTKYVEGQAPVSVPFPDDDILVFDVEVCIKLGELPTLATAVSQSAWYGWVCPDLAEGIDSIPKKSYSTNMLVPFEGKAVNKDKPRLIIGHNVSYDRARIREQYYIKNSALRFLDTMSLHISIGGINKAQKNKLASNKTLEYEDDIGKELCLCSLKELYSLYCGKELEKEMRNTFVEGLMPDVRKDFQSLMEYCSNDVKATYEVLQATFPVFLYRFSHPVTLAGMLEMGSAFLTVNKNWEKFLIEADETYEDLKSEISSILSEKCDNACRLLYNEDYKKDLWMWSEDWSTQELKLTKRKLKKNSGETPSEVAKKSEELKEEEEDDDEKALKLKYQHLFDLKEALPKKLPFLPGYPLWYRKLCEKPGSPDWTPSPQVTTSMYLTPKLLNLTWENFPLYHTQQYGWGVLIPDIFAENVETSIPFEKLKELTIKNCNIDMTELENKMKVETKNRVSKNVSVPYYEGSGIRCNHVVDNCCIFLKIPHKDGNNRNVGNPLSKDTAHVFARGILKSSDANAEKVLDLGGKITYWRNSRQRITSQMVVWLNKKEANTVHISDEDSQTGVIIPKVVVCGTLTRRAMESTWLTASKVTTNRIGSELRSLIQAPPGYHFVGADVDSQELWIASLIGDSYYAKVHGSTPLGWMTLSGTKASGTDMHSVTAKAVGISRDHAKIINYARIYGAGVRFAQKLLKQFNPSMSESEARAKALKMYHLTKGVKEFKIKESALEEFADTFGPDLKVYDLSAAVALSKRVSKKVEDIFEKSIWVNGTESAMFNQLEKIASSVKPVTPFLRGRLSRALEPRFEGDDLHMNTRINWVVQSGAVDFLHLMLVCMKWLTNGRARYCFSFHDEVRYMIPSNERYNGALALHITNLLVRSFCAHRLGMYDLPQSVAFFSSVEVDKCFRKEANDDCITPSNPHGIEREYGIAPGESLNIYEAIEKSGGSLSPFGIVKKRASSLSSNITSQRAEAFNTEMSQATKRKHVHRELLHGDLVPPKENQQIVRVVGSRGSNLHEVETAESEKFLASMPSKFRRNVWIKRGDYILVEPIEEGGKVKAEIVNILTADYIKYLKKENIWPSEFSEKTEEEASATSGDDDLFVNTNRKPVFNDDEPVGQ